VPGPSSPELLPPVIAVGELEDLDDPVLADVRWYLDGRSGHAAYLAGHVPGAIFVDLDEHLAAAPSADGRHPLPTSQRFAASLGRLGVAESDTVVAYDDTGGMVAARLVWMLRSLGQQAALLDGGIWCWPGALDTAATFRPAVEVPARPWPDDLLADADAVTRAVASGVAVVDARAAERYRGDVEPVDARAGHIPGAANVPFATNLGPDGRFLSPDELRCRYATVGIVAGPDRPPADVEGRPILYCGSGVSACHGLLAVERAGLGRARLYAGSWSAWSADPFRPVATGADQLRDA
jgi:thiosulfate/3-mercaptopyruvate sulfurtransferase